MPPFFSSAGDALTASPVGWLEKETKDSSPSVCPFVLADDILHLFQANRMIAFRANPPIAGIRFDAFRILTYVLTAANGTFDFFLELQISFG
jgi:hypothetical protein